MQLHSYGILIVVNALQYDCYKYFHLVRVLFATMSGYVKELKSQKGFMHVSLFHCLLPVKSIIISNTMSLVVLQKIMRIADIFLSTFSAHIMF